MALRPKATRGAVRIVGERVHLRAPTSGDRADFLEAVGNSRDLLEPWVFPPSRRSDFDIFLGRARQDEHVSSLVITNDGNEIAGGVNLNNIIRGNFENAFVGYYGLRPHVGTGLMTEAVSLAIRHAFEDLALHRLEANIQPDNHRSIALAKRCGFQLEGFSPDYLYIGGAWRDHERWAITRPR